MENETTIQEEIKLEQEKNHDVRGTVEGLIDAISVMELDQQALRKRLIMAISVIKNLEEKVDSIPCFLLKQGG